LLFYLLSFLSLKKYLIFFTLLYRNKIASLSIIFIIIFILLLYGTDYLIKTHLLEKFFKNKVTSSIFYFIVILLITEVIGNILSKYIEKTRLLKTSSLFINIIKIFIILIGGLIIVQYMGISITPILTTLGIGGLAVALALQDTLGNFFAGVNLLVSKQIKIGDYIKLSSGEEGYVTDINWRFTKIRDLLNNVTIVPNSKISTSIIKNYYMPITNLTILIEIGVSYDSDLEKVEKVAIEVAKEVLKELNIKSEKEPFVRYREFADFSINFVVGIEVEEFVQQYMVKHLFIKKLHKRFQEENITIPFPITTVYLSSPN